LVSIDDRRALLTEAMPNSPARMSFDRVSNVVLGDLA
jgi:hypothetical protein